MVNEILLEILEEYQKLYAELVTMGVPNEALEIVKKSIDDTNSLIKEREARERESRALPPAPVAEAPVLTVGNSLTTSELVEFLELKKLRIVIPKLRN